MDWTFIRALRIKKFLDILPVKRLLHFGYLEVHKDSCMNRNPMDSIVNTLHNNQQDKGNDQINIMFGCNYLKKNTIKGSFYHLSLFLFTLRDIKQ